VAQIFITQVGIDEEVFKVRGQRSRSCVYKCVNAVTAEAYISTAWRRGSLVGACVSFVVNFAVRKNGARFII